MSNATREKLSDVLMSEPHVEKVQNGLPAAYCRTMAENISEILADTYQLVIKSQLYHWNVVGPVFKPLHELTEEHYGALFAATDILAERIRALGHLAPVLPKYVESFAPQSAKVDFGSVAHMVDDLIASHDQACRNIRKVAKTAETNHDFVTTDLLTTRLAFHEKAVWMLQAIVTAA